MRAVEESTQPQWQSRSMTHGILGQNTLSGDQRWQSVECVVASASFAKSARLSSFLLYVCEKTLLGYTDEITEQQIGVNVFGRSPDYNPGDDNIVRGAARQLRQRLALYYQEEGAFDEWRISIPRGGYIAVIDRQHASESAAVAPIPGEHTTSLQDEAEEIPLESVGPQYVILQKKLVMPLLGFALGIFVLLSYQHFLAPKGVESPTGPLWHALFTKDRRTVIVAGDAGLNMFNNLARRKVSASEYRTRSYLNSPFAETPDGYTWTPFVRRQYTSFPDLLLVSKIVRRPEVIPDRLDVRFARNVSMEDLKEPNVILLGSENYNPWVGLLGNGLNFHLVWHGDTNTTEITNDKPNPREEVSYQAGRAIGSDRQSGYALIDFLDRKGSGGNVLLVQGTSMLGIDAAIDYISQETEFGDVLKQARDSNGQLKSFEILLETDFVNGNTQNTHSIATRIYS